MNQIKRMKRFELSTLSLARRCSTTELHPQVGAWDVSLTTKKSCTTRAPSVNTASPGTVDANFGPAADKHS